MRCQGPVHLCCLSCLVERMCRPPCFLQAAAEPVAVGSVLSPLHSAWRLPAPGLTFPEVLSHSASCYSLWQVRLHHSERQQTWAEARRRGLFHTSHWSSLLEVPRSLGVYRRSGEVSITLLARHATPSASQVWGVVRGRGGGLVDGGEGHCSDSSVVSAVRLPKTKLHGWFSWVQWSRVTQVPHPEVKIEAWFTCHFVPSAVATHHEGVRDHLLIRPVSRRVIGGFREKVTRLLNWLFTLLVKERCTEESSHYCEMLLHYCCSCK